MRLTLSATGLPPAVVGAIYATVHRHGKVERLESGPDDSPPPVPGLFTRTDPQHGVPTGGAPIGDEDVGNGSGYGGGG